MTTAVLDPPRLRPVSNDTPPPHPVNVVDQKFTWSAGAPHGDCRACGRWARGLYIGTRHVMELPVVHARVTTGHGRTADVTYLISREGGSKRIQATADDIEKGRAARRLGIQWTPSHQIVDAWAATIYALAHDPDVREVSATVRPDDRDRGRIPLPPPECAPEGYFTQHPGHGDRGRQAAAAIVSVARNRPRIALAVGASVASPYTGPLRRQSHWLHLFGPRRQGKTTTLQACASVWGDPRMPPSPGIYASWDATAKGPQRRLGMLGIYPMFLDEIGTADLTPGEIARQCLTTTQGASRLMADTYSDSERRTPGWQGVITLTGNGRATGGVPLVGKLAGVAARLVELETPFTGDHGDARRLERAAVHGWGWLGPEVLARFPVREMAALISRARGYLPVPAGGTAGTLADHLAQAIAGAMAVDAVVGTRSLLADAALRAALDYLECHLDEPESDSERLLSVLAEDLASHRPAWPSEDDYRQLGAPRPYSGDGLAQHGYEREIAGVAGDDWLYVFPSTLRRICDREGVDDATALRELHDKGALQVEAARLAKGNGYQVAKRFGGGRDGSRVRVYCIARAVVELHGDGGQDDDPEPPVTPPPTRPAAPVLTVVPDPPPAQAPRPAVAPVALLTDDRAAARTRWLAEAKARLDWTPAQHQALSDAAAALDDNAPPARLRILAALEGDRGGPGPFAPMRGNRQPYWAPDLPAVVEAAHVQNSGWAYQRDDYTGPVVAVDANGAWPSAVSSVVVSHGRLTPSGPVDQLPVSGLRPGYYLMTAYPWTEAGMPSPFGHARPGTDLWVPAPAAGLLRDLAAAGRWPDASAADSLTGEPSRLTAWSGLVRELRRYALDRYGPGSDAYDTVKVAFGQALGLLHGSWAAGETVPRRVWKCKARRVDWTHHIQAQGSANLWRRADQCRQLAPDLGPVALRSIDELVLPAAAFDVVTADPGAGRRPPVRLGERYELGTFKVKALESWGGNDGA